MKINKYYLKNKETVCKKARERIIKIKYNFSIEEYEELRSLQKYKCKICKKDKDKIYQANKNEQEKNHLVKHWIAYCHHIYCKSLQQKQPSY